VAEGTREYEAARIGPAGRLVVGVLAWLGYLLVARPGPFDPAWPHALLLLAVLVLVPAGLRLAVRALPGLRAGSLLRAARHLHLAAGILLVLAYVDGQGAVAAVLSGAWLAVTGLVALAGFLRIVRRGLRGARDDPGATVADAGLAFLAVGGAWVLADRLGYRPLGFSPLIVLLTGGHFHYAGFLLPLFAGLAIRRSGAAGAPDLLARATGPLVVAGVPAVAVGITASQLGLGTWIEAAAAWTMAAGGLLVAWLHLRLALGRGAPAPPAARALWAVAALSLAAGMVLAALYGARFLLPEVRWLDIAWMQALHGGANSFGFALPALAGWWLASARSGASG
jgi:hypothetical protein